MDKQGGKIKMSKIELGKCPYCKSESYDSVESEFVTESTKPYVVVACSCNECKKTFTEYYGLDEVAFDVGDETEYASNTISDEEKQILLKALNLLINQEEDTKDYTNLINKLNGGIEKYA
jgi:transcriptional regulator NrdR family protein